MLSRPPGALARFLGTRSWVQQVTSSTGCPWGWTWRSPAEGVDRAPSDGDVFPGQREWCDLGFTDRNCDPSDEGDILCYRDADGDGWGSGPLVRVCPQTEFAGCPPGYVDRSGDCCDSDSRARPGQTTSYDTPRTGCGGWDFDCDGTVRARYGVTSGSCEASSSTACTAASSRVRPGFTTTVACGITGEFIGGCNWHIRDRECNYRQTLTRQSCR